METLVGGVPVNLDPNGTRNWMPKSLKECSLSMPLYEFELVLA